MKFERGREYRGRIAGFGAYHHAMCTLEGDKANARFVHVDKNLKEFFRSTYRVREVSADQAFGCLLPWDKPSVVHRRNAYSYEQIAKNAEISARRGDSGYYSITGPFPTLHGAPLDHCQSKASEWSTGRRERGDSWKFFALVGLSALRAFYPQRY